MAMAMFAAATPVQSQEVHYLRALTELRTARDYLQFDHRPMFADVRHHAIDEINKAIQEIKHAAWDDGKSTSFKTDGVTDPGAPMHEAMAHLNAAQVQVEHGVDRPENMGLRERAHAHIHEAQLAVSSALQAH
jgi:hypothetical protein